jgi:YHS domain-containing protein
MKKNTATMIATASAVTLLLASCSTSSTDPHAGHDMPGMTSSIVKPYTSDKCPVTGKKLGSMGNPVSIVHNGQEVKFCCKPCIPKFKANPDKYLANL